MGEIGSSGGTGRARDGIYALLAGSLAGRLGRTARARRQARLLSGGVYVALGLGTALSGARAKP